MALAALLSLGMLGLLLAAPILPQPGVESTPTPTAAPSETPEAILPPLGRFVSRTPLSFGSCFAIELEPRSYPVGEDAPPGLASVLWWEGGMTGCGARSNELAGVEAEVTKVLSDEGLDGLIGYNLAFALPLQAGETEIDVEIAILPVRESSPLVLQALELNSPGAGLVLDRFDEIDPTLDPLPSGG